jgi:hypothetical protein
MGWWPPEGMELHDAGNGVQWSWFTTKKEGRVGILEWHHCSGSKGPQPSPGAIYFTHAPAEWRGPRWTLQKEDPLTISPSIRCRACGLHGFIQEGRWIPA